ARGGEVRDDVVGVGRQRAVGGVRDLVADLVAVGGAPDVGGVALDVRERGADRPHLRAAARVRPGVDERVAAHLELAAHGQGGGMEVEIPLGWVGLLSAQMACSTPASASARAWVTARWLLAMVGSVAESTEKPTTSADRMSSASIAIGSATPRWSVSNASRVV